MPGTLVAGPSSSSTASCDERGSPGRKAVSEDDVHHKTPTSDGKKAATSLQPPKKPGRQLKTRSKPNAKKATGKSKVQSLPPSKTEESCHDCDTLEMKEGPEDGVHGRGLTSGCEEATVGLQLPKSAGRQPKKRPKPKAKKATGQSKVQPLLLPETKNTSGIEEGAEDDVHGQVLTSGCEEATVSPQQPKNAGRHPKKGSKPKAKKATGPSKVQPLRLTKTKGSCRGSDTPGMKEDPVDNVNEEAAVSLQLSKKAGRAPKKGTKLMSQKPDRSSNLQSSQLFKAFAKTPPPSRPSSSTIGKEKSSSPSFTPKAPKRRTSMEPPSCCGPSTSKRGKSNSEYSPDENGDVVSWCKSCRKRLNPPEVVNFSGDPKDAAEESVALFDPRLTSSLCSQDDLTEQPQLKITLFTVYDEHGHVCPFDGGLIESDVPLYMSGYMKSICAEDASTDDGVPAARLGPIVSWWTTGYDGGSNVVLGVTTAFAEYVLMRPSPQYKAHMNRTQEKIYLIKGILDHLLEAGADVAYNDVVGRLEQLSGLPHGIGPFSAETVHRHAQFVVDHIQAFDSAGSCKDAPLLGSSFVKELTRATGAVIRDGGEWNRSLAVTGKKTKKVVSKAPPQFLMPSVEKTISELFHDKERVVANQAAARKERCGFCEACLASDCQHCTFCKNMKKHGGSGTLKQCCVRRRCDNREVHGSDDHLGVDVMDETVSALASKPFAKRRFPPVIGSLLCTWVSPPLKSKADAVFYSSVKIGASFTVNVGDDVSVRSFYPKTPAYIGRVVALVETGSSKSFAHVVWFRRHSETVMGNVFGDPAEVFLTSECDDVPLAAISSILSVDVAGARLDSGRHFEGTKLQCNLFCDQAHCVFKTLSVEEGVACGCGLLLDEGSNGAPDDISYEVGDCIFVEPQAVPMPQKCRKENANGATVALENDNDLYSERYRKLLRPPKIEDAALPEPYRICQIVSVKERGCMIVRAFYRAHELQLNSADSYLLFYSQKNFDISVAAIVSKCQVMYTSDFIVATSFDVVKPPFYFRNGYDMDTDTIFEVPEKAMSIGRSTKVEGRRVNELFPIVDVYCGSGGLSLGFRDASLAEPRFAVSDESAHRSTFKKNFPDAVVPSRDPKTVLKELSTSGVGQLLGGMQKEDVFLLCGSPSFASLQNFRPLRGVDNETFRESQVSTFLSYCAFFEPEFVVLAAERGMVRYHDGAVLAFVLRFFLNLGYQVACSVLQDGCYGPPQRNRRLVIIAAKGGQVLPEFPQATHSFELTKNELSFVVDGRAYSSPVRSTSAAPYRRMTLRDAIGHMQDFRSLTMSDFESRLYRGGAGDVGGPVFKKMTPLAQARLAAIPKMPGADWRDLPNVETHLSDGATAYKLFYTHHGVQHEGKRRGVCACADTASQCHPMFRQEDTLIPWSLVHTGHKRDHWSGVYGRLQWDGYLHGAVANPEPLSRRGTVIHPDQDRVISVRECARVQGYPDDFLFEGTVLEQYKQIATSVSPLVACAIGAEILEIL